jgi:hypothetical protein
MEISLQRATNIKIFTGEGGGGYITIKPRYFQIEHIFREGQTPENVEIFSENYFTSKQTDP